MTVTVTKIDSSQRGGKNFITWAWLASTTIIYNNFVSKSKIHHLLNYVSKNKEIPRISFIFFGLAQRSAKI
jgi:hypothetical protein